MTAKKILRFILLFVITYTILFIPASGFRKLYCAAYRALGAELFAHVGDKGLVFLTFKPKETTVIKVFIANIDLKKGDDFHGTHDDFNIYNSGLLLAAIFFISLVVATPLSWMRKIIALPGGYFLILLYAMLKLHLYILFFYTLNPWIGLFQEEQQKVSINFWYNNFAVHETPDFTFVLILWMLLCIGKKEWQQLNAVFSAGIIKKKPAQVKKLVKK